jgi:hypothetical protein
VQGAFTATVLTDLAIAIGSKQVFVDKSKAITINEFEQTCLRVSVENYLAGEANKLQEEIQKAQAARESFKGDYSDIGYIALLVLIDQNEERLAKITGAKNNINQWLEFYFKNPQAPMYPPGVKGGWVGSK